MSENDDSSIEPRKRGGQGVAAMNTNAVCGAISVDQNSEILMITKSGQAVRCPVVNIRETNRGSKGVKLVGLRDNDCLIGISEVVELDEETNNDSSLFDGNAEVVDREAIGLNKETNPD